MSTATLAQPQGHFGYKIIRIIKTSSLGIGSYGAVYRAVCDELQCAAKIIHPTLFKANDPATRKIMERFEKECQFLSGVRHPHIVQYLGVSKDSESGLPVLLMELMDCSLTQFLDQSKEPLLYHIQVSLCHDVALALAYLHSNDIMHRDLSSNNVLLIGQGHRAKVTDFGMSRLAKANPRVTPMTMCPGTQAYMPPEALEDSSVYTNKLDCFSFGVLDIQILTRQFPNPGQHNRIMEMNDPRFPTGQIKVPVPEVKRRQSHIDLVNPTHPLLSVALDCLKDVDRERPSAQELCHRLAALKEAHQYGESLQQARSTSGQDKEKFRKLQREGEVQALQIKQHVQQIRDLKQQVKAQSNRFQARERELSQQICSLQLQLQEKNRCEMERRVQEIDTPIQSNGLISAAPREKERRVQKLDTQIQSNGLISAELQQKPASVRREEQIQKPRQKRALRRERLERFQMQQLPLDETQEIEEHESVCGNTQQPQQIQTAKQQQTEPQACILSKVDVVDSFQLQWRDGRKAPFRWELGSAAVGGDISYFNPESGYGFDIFGYKAGTWSTLPECGRCEFAMAVINDLLTVIGGLNNKLVTCNSLLSLTEEGQGRKWVEHFPPMPTRRAKPAVVCNGKCLVVAGGREEEYKQLNAVEVMDTDTLQWFTATSLPDTNGIASSCSTGFTTLCGDQIYVRCGLQGNWTQSIVACSLTDLLQSCQSTPQSQSWSLGRFGTLLSKVSKQRKESEHAHVWRKVAELPCECSTITSMCGQLLSVGGVDPTDLDPHARKPTDSIHRYNPATDSWEVISHMPTARCDCLVTVLPSNELMVVGGRIHGAYGGCTDIVEIGTLF